MRQVDYFAAVAIALSVVDSIPAILIEELVSFTVWAFSFQRVKKHHASRDSSPA
jgi:hypothetical protein